MLFRSKPESRLNPSSGPNGNGNGNTSSPSAASPGRGIVSNGLSDPDSLLSPGGRPVDAVNGVLTGLNHAANGFNGPDFLSFHMMAIANDHLRYQISIYPLVHPHSLAPKQTVDESRPLRFPQIPLFSAPATLLHLPISHRLLQLRMPVTFSDRECRVAGAKCILNPARIPLVSASPRFKVSLKRLSDALRLPFSKEVPPSSLVGVWMSIS